MSAPKVETDVATCHKPWQNREVEQWLHEDRCPTLQLCVPPQICQAMYGLTASEQNQLEQVERDATEWPHPERMNLGK